MCERLSAWSNCIRRVVYDYFVLWPATMLEALIMIGINVALIAFNYFLYKIVFKAGDLW